MPEDVAYILSKSRVDTLQDGKVMAVVKKVPIDGQAAFRLYIVDLQMYVPALSCRSR